MENKTKSAKRRRHSNRHVTHYRIRNRVGTSFGQPVPIGFYLNPLLGDESKTDRVKIVELFNMETYG